MNYLCEDSEYLRDPAITDPDLATVQNVMFPVPTQHSTTPDRLATQRDSAKHLINNTFFCNYAAWLKVLHPSKGSSHSQPKNMLNMKISPCTSIFMFSTQ